MGSLQRFGIRADRERPARIESQAGPGFHMHLENSKQSLYFNPLSLDGKLYFIETGKN